MRFARIAAGGLAALAAGAAVWILGGNAVAGKREREVSRSFEAVFGPRAALVAKYAFAASNAEAKKVEELTRAVGYNLAASKAPNGGSSSSVPEAERAAVSAYVAAELARDDVAVEAPPPAVGAALASRRVALSALADALIAGEAPRWAYDASAWNEERLSPNGFGHVQVQRLLIAAALASVAQGEDVEAARWLEASWKLNEGFSSRPEIIAQLIAIAVARYEAAALRKIDANRSVWGPRLATMGSRTRLLEAFLLERLDPADGHARYWHAVRKERSWWGHNLLAVFEEPLERLSAAAGNKAWWRAMKAIRDGPAFGEKASDPPPGNDATGLGIGFSMPNIRDGFRRADRLALDAELTEKVLRAKAARAAAGAWPSPSAEIAASCFPGLGWNYRVDGGTMTIALNRELPRPVAGLVLPTSFSSR